MRSLGLHRLTAAHAIRAETTGVGDRYVLERMNAGRFSCGGEQSGHVITSDYVTTGEGLLTEVDAKRIADRLARVVGG